MGHSGGVEVRTEIVGEALLRDYPLRLWAQQQEHTDEVLREFKLLLGGQAAGTTSAPAQLVALATLFDTHFGPLVDAITAARQRAYDAGEARMDLRMPLPRSTPELMARFREVWAAVDEYCRSGDLLTLGRPPELVRLMDWAADELSAQARGAAPTPWPGPF